MRILACADLHGVPERAVCVRDLIAELAPDVVVLAGDIAEHHGADAAAQFAAAYGERSWDAAKARFYLDLYELF